MTEQAASSVAAIQLRQAALAKQHNTIADADRMLVQALVSAHATVRESLRHLDAIAAEIDRAVTGQAQLALDTPLGAREFQRFLVTKQREIEALVATARDIDRTKSAALQRLRSHYAGEAG